MLLYAYHELESCEPFGHLMPMSRTEQLNPRLKTDAENARPRVALFGTGLAT